MASPFPFDRSPELFDVLFAVQDDAANRNAPMEAEYILLGLLKDSFVVDILGLVEVSPSDVEQRIKHWAACREAPSGGSGELSLTVKKILAFAMNQMHMLGDKEFGSEHMLLGIIREGRSYAAAVLVEHDIRLLDIEWAIKRLSTLASITA